MFRSLKRSIQLINKDEFDTAVYKATCEEDFLKPKEKHLNIIIECLRGDNKVVLVLDAFTRIQDQIQSINFNNWANSLKWCFILHICIYSNCKIFVEAICCNGIFVQVFNTQSALKNHDFVSFLHGSIANNYFRYLQNRYENLIYFQNAMDDFEQKEESQKQLIIHKIIQTLQLILKMDKELEISLQKFQRFELLKHIVFLLLRDLIFFYPIVTDFIEKRIALITTTEISIATKIYQNYTELIRMGRHVKKILLLKHMIADNVSEFNVLNDIRIFQVNQCKNQEIELYFSGLNVQEVPFKSLSQTDRIALKPSTLNTPVLSHINLNAPILSHTTLSPTLKSIDHIEIIQFDDENLNVFQEESQENNIINLTFYSNKYEGQILKEQPQLRDEDSDVLVIENPEPQQIKVSSNSNSRQPQQRKQQFLLRKPRDSKPEFPVQENQTNISSTTYQSITNDYSENRILGGQKKQSSNQKGKQQNDGFYDMKQSPLGFLSYQSDEPIGFFINNKNM